MQHIAYSKTMSGMRTRKKRPVNGRVPEMNNAQHLDGLQVGAAAAEMGHSRPIMNAPEENDKNNSQVQDFSNLHQMNRVSPNKEQDGNRIINGNSLAKDVNIGRNMDAELRAAAAEKRRSNFLKSVSQANDENSQVQDVHGDTSVPRRQRRKSIEIYRPKRKYTPDAGGCMKTKDHQKKQNHNLEAPRSSNKSNDNPDPMHTLPGKENRRPKRQRVSKEKHVPDDLAQAISNLLKAHGGAILYDEIMPECEKILKKCFDVSAMGFFSFSQLLKFLYPNLDFLTMENKRIVYDSAFIKQKDIIAANFTATTSPIHKGVGGSKKAEDLENRQQNRKAGPLRPLDTNRNIPEPLPSLPVGEKKSSGPKKQEAAPTKRSINKQEHENRKAQSPEKQNTNASPLIHDSPSNQKQRCVPETQHQSQAGPPALTPSVPQQTTSQRNEVHNPNQQRQNMEIRQNRRKENQRCAPTEKPSQKEGPVRRTAIFPPPSAESLGAKRSKELRVPEDLAQTIFSLLHSNGGAIPYHDIHPECESRLKRNLDVMAMGFFGFRHLLKVLDPNIEILTEGKKWIVYDSTVIKRQDLLDDNLPITTTPIQKFKGMLVHTISHNHEFRGRHLTKTVSKRLSKLLIEHFPCGVPGNELSSLYFGVFGDMADLNPETYGFRDLSTLLRNEPSLVRFEGRYVVAATFTNTCKPVIGKEIEKIDGIPRGAVKKSYRLEYLQWNNFMRNGQKFASMINGYYSPSDFSFLLQGQNYSEALLIMEDRLQFFYESPFVQDTYKLTQDKLFMTEEYPFCAYCERHDRYYRAVFRSLETAEVVKVYFIDYGNTEPVLIKNLYYLHTSLLSTPPLAMKGELFGIKPPNARSEFDKNWPVNSVDFLLDHIVDQTLLVVPHCMANDTAYVTLYKVPQKFRNSELTAVLGEVDQAVNLNDLLVKHNLAEFICAERYQTDLRKLREDEIDPYRPPVPRTYTPPTPLTFDVGPSDVPCSVDTDPVADTVPPLVDDSVEVTRLRHFKGTLYILTIGGHLYIPMNEFKKEPYNTDDQIQELLYESKPKQISSASHPNIFRDLVRQKFPLAHEEQNRTLTLVAVYSLEMHRSESVSVATLFSCLETLDELHS